MNRALVFVAAVAAVAMAGRGLAEPAGAAAPDAPVGCAWGSLTERPVLLCKTASGDMAPADLPAGFDPLTMAAARAGNAKAMTALGRFYLRGPAAQRDDAEAARWFHKSVALEEPDAMIELGRMIGQHRGLPQDRSAAVHWRSLPSPDDLMLAYPIEAAAAGVTGEAMLQCRLDANHVPGQCRVLWEQPTSAGFGGAALSLANRFQLNDGLPVSSLINLPVRFELEDPAPPRNQADQCAAYAIALMRTESLPPDADWQARYWVARSRYATRAAGEADTPDRLAGAVAADAARIASGKDRGLFSLRARCML